MKWLIVLLLTSALGFAIVVVANYFFYLILCDVNGASDADQQIRYWRVGTKSLRIVKRHRELFPESRRRLQWGWLGAVGSFLYLVPLVGGVVALKMRWITLR